ncbi:hypothetical protein JCM19236_4665 [Vibrio sp. JCM 19236]|nr:hypothetical protein JCM19236_4665 [Vibrio sp. JCM 19236]
MAKPLAEREYHVDFAGLMRLYETNYAKLNALLPVNHDEGTLEPTKFSLRYIKSMS